MITRQGRVEVLNDEDCREFPWHPKPVLELSDSNAVQLNEGPCLVLFVGMELKGKWKTSEQTAYGRQIVFPAPQPLSVINSVDLWSLSPQQPCF